MNLPDKLSLAFLPTPIYKLEQVSKKYNKEIYIKRDDLTGVETSGNKIRKLEYSVKRALLQGCDMLITCGGMQSNHARATAFVAAKMQMKCCLLLRGGKEEAVEGNYFLDKLVGADIIIKSPEEFNQNKQQLMEDIKRKYEKMGYKPYIIPMGASDGIGTFGYISCMEEILKQEQQMHLCFEAIIDAVGSGGTYAGLYIGSQLYQTNKKIIGFNVCDSAKYFYEEINAIIDDTSTYRKEANVDRKEITIIDGYVGKGYAISTPEELQVLQELAQTEGVVLDPVYTGKAYYGFIQELEKGTFDAFQTILFMHTGGIFGLFPKQNQFHF